MCFIHQCLLHLSFSFHLRSTTPSSIAGLYDRHFEAITPLNDRSGKHLSFFLFFSYLLFIDILFLFAGVCLNVNVAHSTSIRVFSLSLSLILPVCLCSVSCMLQNAESHHRSFQKINNSIHSRTDSKTSSR